ncbi:hypothetical protein PIROE2DRAFT_14410 [Piromyces sp. E2]|nr:hypothetical protein PIROE2DRAFT_14410 [Piromyces sp. E2]|eukprot:OUM59932.1 hypothetical protein PIROE2DRAFT_14410 [Piromyces sp. E2]
MRHKNTLVLFFIFFCISICKIHAKEIVLENDSISFFNLAATVKDFQNDGNLKLIFKDDYYDMSMIYTNSSVDISVNSNISFIGSKNGSVFDFKKNKLGAFNISFARTKIDTVRFENITFTNYREKVLSDQGMSLMTINSSADKYNLIFENCNFTENNFILFDINFACKKTTNPLFSFNNCNFM